MILSDMACMSSMLMGALLASDSGEKMVADAAVRAPCRSLRSPCRILLTRFDLEGSAGVVSACVTVVLLVASVVAALMDLSLLADLLFPFFLLDCFPIFNTFLFWS
jgi:hypothetical protein